MPVYPRQEIETISNERGTLEVTLQKQEESRNNYQDRIDNANQRIDEIRRRIDQIAAEQRPHREAMTQASSEIKRVNVAKRDIQTEAATVERTIKSDEDEIKRLQRSIDEERQRLARDVGCACVPRKHHMTMPNRLTKAVIHPNFVILSAATKRQSSRTNVARLQRPSRPPFAPKATYARRETFNDSVAWR